MRKWNDDPFTKKAQRENFLARSVYKLEEIDKKERLFKQARKILDLGAAPGAWSQYALKAMGNEGTVWALDLEAIKFSDPRLISIQGDAETINMEEFLRNEQMDLVMSDMAPKTSGIHERDVALSHSLVELAITLAEKHLLKGGTFIAKVFMGSDWKSLEDRLKKRFKQVKLLRPESTRKHSREIYFIALNFQG